MGQSRHDVPCRGYGVNRAPPVQQLECADSVALLILTMVATTGLERSVATSDTMLSHSAASYFSSEEALQNPITVPEPRGPIQLPGILPLTST
jgi:hypothetical protein